MTTLQRTKEALLVIDVQVGIMETAFEGPKKVELIAAIVDRARKAGVPVIWVQHNEPGFERDSDGWQLSPELVPPPNEPHIHKNFRSSFESTELDEVLEKLGVGHVYLCGAESNHCVRFTTHSALDRGYDVTLIADAHTTTGFEWNGIVVDAKAVIDEQNTNFGGFALPGRTMAVLASSELPF